MTKQRHNNQSGFTLIEMIVSLGVFATVVTIAVGALLVLVSANEQLQSEQNVMINLSFALDSMTREIRTGSDYYCAVSTSETPFFSTSDLDEITTTQNCTSFQEGQIFRGIAFKEGGDSVTGTDDYILYFYRGDAVADGGQRLYRRVGNQAPVPITAEDILITDAQFYVSGTATLEDNNREQPIVTIIIDATDTDGESPTTIQTTVTQRTLDL